MSSAVTTIKSPLIDDAYRALLENVLTKVQEGSIATIPELRLALYDEILQYYKDLDADAVKLNGYSWEEYRNPVVHNNNQKTIKKNLDIIEKEVIDLSKTTTAYFNYITKATYDITAKTKEIDDRLMAFKEHNIDLRQFAAAGRSLIVLSDDFNDLSKIDFSKSKDIYTSLGDSQITLSPEQNINRATNVKEISVFTNKASDANVDLNDPVQLASIASFSSDPTGDDGKLPWYPRAYEGYRFAPLGNARPEGGAWRIETANEKVATKAVEYDAKYTDLAKTPAPLNANIIPALGAPNFPPVVATSSAVATKYTIVKRLKSTSDPLVTVTTDAKDVDYASVTPAYITDSGNDYYYVIGWTNSLPNGDESEVDESSNTTYEFLALKVAGAAGPTTPNINKYDPRYTPEEYIFDQPFGNNTVTYGVQGAKVLVSTDLKYAEVAPSKELATTSRLRMVDGDTRTFWEIEYTPYVSAIQVAADGTTIERKRAAANALAASTDSSLTAMTVTIEYKLVSEFTINYIDITPVYFTDYQLAPWTVTNLFINDLPITISSQRVTLDANETLSANTINNNGITDPYAFKGKAFIEFSPVKASKIKIVILQSKPVVNYYELSNYQMVKKSNYSISQSYSSSSSSSKMFGKTKSSSVNQSDGISEKGTATILFQDGYLETIVKSGSGANEATLANTANSSSGSGSGSGKDSQLGSLIGAGIGTIFGGALGGAVGGIIGGAFNKSSSSSTSSSGSRSYSDTGWQIGLEYAKALWSRPRYAVGISEIGFYSRSYIPSGTFVSKEYKVPAGNKTLRFAVSENIPTSFLSYSQIEAYIEYYIIIEGVEIRMKPESGADSSVAHEGLISELDLTKYKEGKTTNSIRLKAVLKRPDNKDFPDANSLTPALKAYKIIIEDIL